MIMNEKTVDDRFSMEEIEKKLSLMKNSELVAWNKLIYVCERLCTLYFQNRMNDILQRESTKMCYALNVCGRESNDSKAKKRAE